MHSYHSMITRKVTTLDRSGQRSGKALAVETFRNGLARRYTDETIILKRSFHRRAMPLMSDVDRRRPAGIVDMKLQLIADVKIFVVTQSDLRSRVYLRDPLDRTGRRETGRLFTIHH